MRRRDERAALFTRLRLQGCRVKVKSTEEDIILTQLEDTKLKLNCCSCF